MNSLTSLAKVIEEIFRLFLPLKTGWQKGWHKNVRGLDIIKT